MCNPGLDPEPGRGEASRGCYKGHHWDNWRNLDMDLTLHKSITSMLQFLFLLIALWL